MKKHERSAPGRPGDPPRWTEANKTAVGTAIAATSSVWFTMAGGLLTEVFYPSPDQACIRSLGFMVTDDAGFVSEEGRDTRSEERSPRSAVSPVSTVVSTCARERYRIEKTTLPDPSASVILQRVRFVALEGAATAYHLFCILQPHLGDRGDSSSARVGEYKGRTMLFASCGDGLAVALACSAPWIAASVGFVGRSDGRDAICSHGTLTHLYDHAVEGNVALTGQLDPCAGELTLALAFAPTEKAAAHLAFGALLRGFEAARAGLTAPWEQWSAALPELRLNGERPALWTRSLAVLKTLEAKAANGGRVAALSTPWGASKGPGIDGTYHLVWTRDLVETVTALLAAGAHHEAKRTLFYLRCTQEADGHWPQNMRLDGTSVWNNDELDEAALPLVLLHYLRRANLLDADELRETWPMVRSAAEYVARTGPSTTRDRWEDVEGVTPFTLAASVAGLVVAAEMAELCDHPDLAIAWRARADQWNAGVETWLYRRGGKLADHVGVAGYYVRVRKLGQPFAPLPDFQHLDKTELSPDVLALVRFGLRSPDDPRIVDTLRVVDAVLKTDFESGPSWRRYPGDEYGEHEDGSPFDGHGIGRAWPLLTGERAHYELACGRHGVAEALLRTMESFANASGFLPEQVWNAPDIAERGLVRGGPSGSANPLGWAHAEYVKLCRSLAEGRVYDAVDPVRERYARVTGLTG
jgi:glucoamylase